LGKTMKKGSVLIASDDPALAAELESRLQSLGFRIAGVAVSVAEAVQAALERTPDLVLIDTRLAGHLAAIQGAGKTTVEGKPLREGHSRRYETIVNEMPNGYVLVKVVLDERGRACDHIYLDVNPALEQMFGKPAAELIGKRARDVFPGINPQWFEIYHHLVDNPGRREFEIEATAIGRFFKVVAYLTDDGCSAALVSDITELKRTEEAHRRSEEMLIRARAELEQKVVERTRELEETNRRLIMEIEDRKTLEGILAENERRYRQMVEGTNDLVTQTSAEGEFIYVNASSNTVFGLPVESCIGRKWFDFVHPADREQTRSVVDACLKTRQQTVHLENRQINQSDGTIRNINWTINLNYDKEGNLRYLNSIGQDITALKKTEENLRLAKIIADEANQAKSEFLANISHELRNPMHHILSYSKSGIRKIDTAPREKLLHYFSQINSSGNRLTLLLNDLLDLSRLESGEMQYEMTRQDIVGIVKYTIDEFRLACSERAITIRYQQPAENIEAVVDKLRIGQVISNLITNAVKFSPDGGRVTIKLERGAYCFQTRHFHKNTAAGLQFSISDNGVGIPDRELESIFGRFNQSSRTKTGAGGTGLGLAICKEIILAHQGLIWAENNPDGGAIFTFRIPLDNTGKKPTPVPG